MELEVYSRRGCHLCEDMIADLRRLAPELGFELRILDVDTRDEWRQAYGSLVPVLRGGGREICHYFLDEVALRDFLAGV